MPAETVGSRPRLNLGLLQTLGTIVLVVFILRAASVVIIPFALAVLIVFVLSPLVRFLEGRGLGRTPAVLLTMLLAGLFLTGLGYVMVGQARSLASELPKNKERIRAKIDSIRGSGGIISEVTETLNELARGDGAGKNPLPEGDPPPGGETPPPVETKPTTTVEQKIPAGPLGQGEKTVARPAEEGGIAEMAETALPVVEGLAQFGLVLILVVFMLSSREDLRNRLIGLIGRGQVTGTTRVLTDAAERVSTLLLMQLIINASYGLVFAIGLWLIGAQYALLWGALALVLRFIPYVGTWLSVIFPLALSFATTDGWTQPLMILAFFGVLDALTGQVIEPIIFGHNTGVSPIALLVAAAFWAWLWGPIGLVLSTPITVCLAVLGANVPRLRPLALLLGDQPALSPPVAFYQRLLAKDQIETKALLKVPAGTTEVAFAQLRHYDASAVPALVLARKDRESGGITAEEEAGMFDLVDGLVTAETPLKENATEDERATYQARQDELARMPLVVGAPGHHRAEELVLDMLVAGLPEVNRRMTVLSARQLPVEVEQAIESGDAVAVVVGVVPPGGVPQTTYLVKRLRQKFPELPIVVAYFGRTRSFDQLLVRLRRAGATYVTTSLVQTAETLRNIGPQPTTAGRELASAAS